ncbi:hypothetical protein [Flavobacterium sp. XS2P39]|uniref:hypothetical protein n=1 Tax=Flavobacterium sp. XS2P39 TaxID=3401725 RepID=UPI003AAE18B3
MKRIVDFVIKHPISITALVCFLFYFLPFKPKPFGDGEYHEGTIQLIDYIVNGFDGNVRVDKGLFTLFYYFVPYSFAYVFHSDTLYYLFGIIFNSVVTCFAIKYLFASLDLMNFSIKSKFWVIVVMTLFPIHVYYAYGILAESAAFLAVTLFIYSWVKITTNSTSVKYFLILALSMMMLEGTRPNLLPFLVLFLLYVLITKIEWKNKIIFISTLVLMLFLLTTVESKINNTDRVYKKDMFRNQLLWSRFELRDEPFNWLPQHGQDEFASSDYRNNLLKRKELDSICDANKQDKTTYFINWVTNDIIDNPGLTVRQYVLKFFQSQSFIISPLMKSNKSNFVKYGVHIYINSINYVLVLTSLWAMFLLVRNKEYQLFFPILFLWGSSLVFVFLFHSEQRYMFPMRPVLMFLFAYFVNYYYHGKSLSVVVS